MVNLTQIVFVRVMTFTQIFGQCVQNEGQGKSQTNSDNA